MHLVIDCRCIHPRMGGIGRAALELLQAMGEHPRGHRITALVAANHVGEISVKGVHFAPVDGAMIDERFDQLQLPSLLEQLAADAYVNTTFAVPAVKTSRIQASIIHDVVFEDHPEYVEPGLCSYLRRWARFAAERADHVITVSDHARERIRHVYRVNEERVTRVYNGLSARCFEDPSPADLERVRGKFSLQRPYILYLGTLERKKGILQLIEAYAMAAQEGLGEDLVLAGGRGAPDLDLDGSIRKTGLMERIKLPGFVSEEDKKPLLKGASLFVYPSLYEGFGFPPLEAMALGVPTLVSDRTSLPEVVGEAALVTSVEDGAGFSRALLQGTRDPEFRNSALGRGPERARTFSWSRAAEEVLQLCERLGGN